MDLQSRRSPSDRAAGLDHAKSIRRRVAFPESTGSRLLKKGTKPVVAASVS
jgi:hypothetical protein